MPLKLRLQRHGKKGKPFYWLVAADSRFKRDGRYLEKLGIYNPNTNPATVKIDIDRAVNWLEKGAQPTDTARTLLSYRGAMFKHHLNGGVKKGALTQEEADKKLTEWLKQKEAKIQAKKDGLSKDDAEVKAKILAAEKEASEKRLADAAIKEASTEEANTQESDTEAATDEEAATELAATEEASAEEAATKEASTEEAITQESDAEAAPDEEAATEEGADKKTSEAEENKKEE